MPAAQGAGTHGNPVCRQRLEAEGQRQVCNHLDENEEGPEGAGTGPGEGPGDLVTI